MYLSVCLYEPFSCGRVVVYDVTVLAGWVQVADGRQFGELAEHPDSCRGLRTMLLSGCRAPRRRGFGDCEFHRGVPRLRSQLREREGAPSRPQLVETDPLRRTVGIVFPPTRRHHVPPYHGGTERPRSPAPPRKARRSRPSGARPTCRGAERPAYDRRADRNPTVRRRHLEASRQVTTTLDPPPTSADRDTARFTVSSTTSLSRRLPVIKVTFTSSAVRHGARGT
jgi:hypothetical protein